MLLSSLAHVLLLQSAHSLYSEQGVLQAAYLWTPQPADMQASSARVSCKRCLPACSNIVLRRKPVCNLPFL